MFPPSFDYHRATSVGEALDLLDEYADRDPALLAGGHSLLPELKAGETSAEVVVDLDVDALAGVHAPDDRAIVGALTTYADAADSDALQSRAPVLPAAAAEVGDVQIRNRGTVGGNLARAHPAADLPPAVLAAEGTVLLRDRDGKREVPAVEFFRGHGETAVRDGELLTGVRLPGAGDAGAAYAKKTHPATGYAMVGVAAVVDVDGSVVRDARVAATGVQDRPLRLESVESALVDGAADPGTVEAAVAETDADLDESRLRSDARATGEFRAHLLETYAERAVTRAVERAGTDG